MPDKSLQPDAATAIDEALAAVQAIPEFEQDNFVLNDRGLRQADVDRRVAILNARVAQQNAATADRWARSLAWATWVLVAATLVLVVITAIKG
jgi:hypothetical protein